MSHQLIALFGGCVKADRIIYFVVCRIWNFLVATIYRRGWSIYKMFYLMVTTSLKDIVETYEVALDISIGIGNTVTNACLGCKVYDNRNFVFSEKLFYGFFVCDWGMNKRPTWTILSLKRRFTRLLPIKPAAPVTRIVFPSRFIFLFIIIFS